MPHVLDQREVNEAEEPFKKDMKLLKNALVLCTKDFARRNDAIRGSTNDRRGAGGGLLPP